MTRLNGIYGRNMEGSGVTKLEGLASFSGPSEGGSCWTKYTADHILVASAASPRCPLIWRASSTASRPTVFSFGRCPTRPWLWHWRWRASCTWVQDRLLCRRDGRHRCTRSMASWGRSRRRIAFARGRGDEVPLRSVRRAAPERHAGLGDGAPGPDVATEDDDRQGRRGQRQEARHAH